MPYVAVPVNSAADTLITRVAGSVMMENFTEARAKALSGITDAIRRLNMRTWTWTRAQVPITLAPNTIHYVVPVSFKSPNHCALVDALGNEIGGLDYKDSKSFHMEHPDRSVSGTPRVYTATNILSNGLITLNAYPSDTFLSRSPALQLYFNARVAFIADTGVGLVCASEAESFVEWHANAYMAYQYDPSAYAIAKREASEAFERLEVDDNENDFRDWSEGGWWGTDGGSGVGGGGGIGVPSVVTLPATGNVGDMRVVPGPPDVFYQWQTAADASAGWVEIGRGPDGPIT